MKLIGLMPVRNESWVLGLSLRAALKWCDEVVVMDHASSDNSLAIAEAVQMESRKARVAISTEADPKWDEMTHRQWMLDAARRLGATHIAIIDADEVLTANIVPHVRIWVEKCKPGAMLELPGYNLRRGIDQYHANGLWGERWFSTAFLDHPLLHWRGDKFHSRAPAGSHWIPYRPLGHGYGGTLHLWGASERRLRAKHSLYKISERLRWPNKPVAKIEHMYSQCINGNPPHDKPEDWRLKAAPSHWWHPELMKYLDVDAEPWQEAECARLIAEYGREYFAGLDLFGL